MNYRWNNLKTTCWRPHWNTLFLAIQDQTETEAFSKDVA